MSVKFSRRHYEFIAATLKRRVDRIRERQEGVAMATSLSDLREVASDFAREFSGDNPRFDATKFLEACGL